MSEYSIIETKQFRGCGFMTVCKYNNVGDLIYIGDKDSKIVTVIDTLDYNVIGTFEGHNGIVWNLDISKNDLILITASGDLTIGFFNAKNGNKIYQSNEKCIPKYVCAQKDHTTFKTTNLVGIICEALTKKSTTYISIYDLDTIGEENFTEKIKLLWVRQSKPNVMIWSSDNELLIGCDDGKIIRRNINDLNGEFEKEYQIHTQAIKSIVWNKSRTQILTGSLDCEAKQIEIKNGDFDDNLNVLYTYKSSVPINYAIWNHNERKVILGGGIEAMNVAKTSDNDLNIKIYRTTDQKLTNHIGSHFGPIRYIDKAPNSKNFMTASQDGTVKIYFITDDESNGKQADFNQELESEQHNVNEENKENKIIFERFGNGLYSNNSLKNETNKIINLNWKPPKVKEQVVKKKWVPGMPRPKDDDEIYKANDGINLDKMNEYKKQEMDQNSTIRITNLPYWIKVKDLGELFDLYGRIEERGGIKIKEYGNSTMAFIKYVYPESAIKAIENMDGYPIDHHIIKVEIALQK